MGSYVGFQPYFACSGTHLLYFGTSAPFLYYRSSGSRHFSWARRVSLFSFKVSIFKDFSSFI